MRPQRAHQSNVWSWCFCGLARGQPAETLRPLLPQQRLADALHGLKRPLRYCASTQTVYPAINAEKGCADERSCASHAHLDHPAVPPPRWHPAGQPSQRPDNSNYCQCAVILSDFCRSPRDRLLSPWKWQPFASLVILSKAPHSPAGIRLKSIWNQRGGGKPADEPSPNSKPRSKRGRCRPRYGVRSYGRFFAMRYRQPVDPVQGCSDDRPAGCQKILFLSAYIRH